MTNAIVLRNMNYGLVIEPHHGKIPEEHRINVMADIIDGYFVLMASSRGGLSDWNETFGVQEITEVNETAGRIYDYANKKLKDTVKYYRDITKRLGDRTKIKSRNEANVRGLGKSLEELIKFARKNGNLKETSRYHAV